MSHFAYRYFGLVNFMEYGVGEMSLDDRVDRTIQCRREEHCLMVDLYVSEDPFNLGKKPHVCHPVSFVNHNTLN